MKVKFIGAKGPNEDEVCRVFGRSFPRGKIVKLPDSFPFRAKIEGNPAFEIVPDKPAKA